MPTPHKHAALIKQWADDPSQPVWIWTGHQWEPPLHHECPLWLADVPHALGPKPTQPPRKMCVLAGVEFPMPETHPLDCHQCYFVTRVAHIGGVAEFKWAGDAFDLGRLGDGLVHLTREAAEAHGRALLAANKQAIEGAK